MTPDMKLALVVAALFRDCPPHKPVGTLMWEAQADRLAADRPLAAYFASVAEADGWAEERIRMAAKLKDTPPEERGDPMNIYDIHAMLPTWRAWGRVIIDYGNNA